MKKIVLWLRKVFIDDKLCALLVRNSEAIAAENRKMLSKLSLLGMCLMAGIFALSFIFDYLVPLRTLYAPYLFAYVIAHLMSVTVSKKSRIWLRIAAYFLTFVTAAFGIELGIFFNPTGNANLFMVFLIVMPVMFIEKPIIIMCCAFLVCCAFCAFAIFVKDQAHFLTDITNVWICYIISMVTLRMINSVRVENIDARRRLYSESLTDELTQLANRRSFNQHMQSVRQSILQRKGRVAIYMIDIDSFKAFNDTYGHLSGDECLNELGELFLELAAKHNMFFARYGGEEFAAVVLDEAVDLNAVGNEIVAAVSSIAMEHAASPYGRITVSVGCADSITCRTAGDIDLINCADAALYEAKERGKNCFVRYIN